MGDFVEFHRLAGGDFFGEDGNCKLYAIDALWHPSEGAISGPVRCVAQVRLTLQQLSAVTGPDCQTVGASKR